MHCPIEKIEVSAYKIPTATPESDGTFEWNSTTIVVCNISAAGQVGIGYTYANTSTAHFIRNFLTPVVNGQDALDTGWRWEDMVHSVRNLGDTGIASMGISAVDSALWDLKGKILSVSLTTLWGKVREEIPVYGSGGFTSYTISELRNQFAKWKEQGISRFKMKVGRNPSEDIARVKAAREEIGSDAELFVDANGAYTRKQALDFAHRFRDLNVTWFEEPVPSDDLEGLHLLTKTAPPSMNITAGEYGYNLPYFERMLKAEAVDILQADATRCQGLTGFQHVGSLCQAQMIPLSSHTAPALHAQICCALLPVIHLEYFFDHVRIEEMIFDGAPILKNGALIPNFDRPGLGLELKKADATRYAIQF
jgi:L-alanine-DL-glutamate epimerase-like enolase superfamily enzyme